MNEHAGKSPTWWLSILLCGLAILCDLECSAVLKSKHFGSTQSAEDAIVISQTQAERIAELLCKHGRGGQLEVRPARLEKESFWRVVVESRPHRASTDLTNVFYARALSKQEAELLSAEIAKTQLGPGRFEVQPAEFLSGFYWNILVISIPAAPGDYCVLVLSAKNGALVMTIGGI